MKLFVSVQGSVTRYPQFLPYALAQMHVLSDVWDVLFSLGPVYMQSDHKGSWGLLKNESHWLYLAFLSVS